MSEEKNESRYSLNVHLDTSKPGTWNLKPETWDLIHVTQYMLPEILRFVTSYHQAQDRELET